MHLIEVGKPLFSGVNKLQEGVQYNLYDNGHELQLNFSKLKSLEIESVHEGDCEFALAVHGPVIFFLYHFMPAIPWSDCPFSWFLVPEERRIRPAFLESSSKAGLHALLQVILSDADTGIVKALRATTFSKEFTASLHQAILEQIARGRSSKYDEEIARIYQQYPTSEALLETAIARTFGGA